jgi:hypothetical protein
VKQTSIKRDVTENTSPSVPLSLLPVSVHAESWLPVDSIGGHEILKISLNKIVFYD